jgi:putative phosphoribosyl transferase
LLFDLLTAEEEADRANVFDIELLAGRLTRVTAWLRHQPWAQDVRVGWFGASTGAGAALRAAADVAAIVSRGGRPDLAGPRLDAVRAPTLLSSVAWTKRSSTSTAPHRPGCSAPTSS